MLINNHFPILSKSIYLVIIITVSIAYIWSNRNTFWDCSSCFCWNCDILLVAWLTIHCRLSLCWCACEGYIDVVLLCYLLGTFDGLTPKSLDCHMCQTSSSNDFTMTGTSQWPPACCYMIQLELYLVCYLVRFPKGPTVNSLLHWESGLSKQKASQSITK